jgi:hypothetical protein
MLNDQTPLMILGYNRVGGVNILRQLESLNLPNPMDHLHYLSIDSIMQNHSSSEVAQSKLAFRQKFDAEMGEGWKIIVVVRDPIAQAISHFFLALANAEPGLFKGVAYEATFQNLASRFINQFPSLLSAYENWFPSEVTPNLGINLLGSDFDTERGYSVYSDRRYDLLLLRIELPDDDMATCMNAFLGIPNFRLGIASNAARNRFYAGHYDYFRRTIKFDRESLSAIYDKQISKHFYSEQLLTQFTARWS